eukprot:CAMPEP_0117041264 /NCGR_PEP_ID=MMETSP0472-20121206/28835_1 /TAXON_ID=693140 ORGANISM="Tiarina fusus, Strain LIS" /NCGR_SAMPLE_ID=MMETSP0472 /ASSEMBLY_ACC=CAM_ASM_000603 /LENGTH=93 /DNA_ID=CAMNT_0004752241 /DNA_START=264 /DNA_END=545 /DNA_ORIENTATION=+
MLSPKTSMFSAETGDSSGHRLVFTSLMVAIRECGRPRGLLTKEYSSLSELELEPLAEDDLEPVDRFENDVVLLSPASFRRSSSSLDAIVSFRL